LPTTFSSIHRATIKVNSLLSLKDNIFLDAENKFDKKTANAKEEAEINFLTCLTG
jgi:hypothetical protein